MSPLDKTFTNKHAIHCTHHAFSPFSVYTTLMDLRGVEPLSENRLPRPSPSAVGVFNLPYRDAHRQAARFGSS